MPKCARQELQVHASVESGHREAVTERVWCDESEFMPVQTGVIDIL